MLSLLFFTDSTSNNPGRQTNKIKRKTFELPVNRGNHSQRKLSTVFQNKMLKVMSRYQIMVRIKYFYQ